MQSGLPSQAVAPTDQPAPPLGSRLPILQPPAYASRVTVPDLDIDLPVISGDLQPPPSYPLCDVAAYVTRFEQPYEQGITYISAHAQEGMFLPLLEASLQDDGRSMVGMHVDVYTNDAMRYGYTIERVVRHATDYEVINSFSLTERRLILQTSEGPFGTTEKLQIVAVPLDEGPADPAEANPEPMPRDCRPDQLRSGDPPEPSESPGSSPVVIADPTPSFVPPSSPPAPAITAPPSASSPGTSTSPGGGFVPAAFASRVVVADLGIDLPVVSGDLQPPPNYPFCDVAAYVTFLSQPDEVGTTYITAHAQEGMFLPILDASQRDDGVEMLGMTVDVYTTDALRYSYRVWQVQRHITDRVVATDGLQPGEQRLVLQTSEGPYGSTEKLAIAATLVSVEVAEAGEATPVARPRDCEPTGS